MGGKFGNIVHKEGGKLVKNSVVGLLVGPIGSRRMLGKFIFYLYIYLLYITYGC